MQRQKRKRREAPLVPVGLEPKPRVLERRTRMSLGVVAVLLAVAGIVVYAIRPGVGTYQVNGLLILPLFALICYRLHRWLPIRVQWCVAVVATPVGSAAYLLFPDAQWWNYGPLTAMPLVALTVGKLGHGSPEAGDPEPWYGGLSDGPWGPP